MLIPPKPFSPVFPLAPINKDWNCGANQLIGFRDGRSALRFSLKKLIDKPKPHVLVPALYCSSALQTLSDCYLEFYDSSGDGCVEIGSVTRAIRGGDVDAIILNHLFGRVPKERTYLYNLCKRSNVICIDDMCQCAANVLNDHEDFLDDAFDARVFSFRKFLPIPFGGAVLFNKRFEIASGPEIKASYLPKRVKFCLEKLFYTYASNNVFHVALSFDAFLKRFKKNYRFTLDEQLQPISLPKTLLQIILNSRELSAISSQRRYNYKFLSNFFEPFQGNITKKDVPQAFVVFDHSGKIEDAMRDNGVMCYCWPGQELPNAVREQPNKFPNATILADKLLCVPLHQNLSKEQVNYVASVFKQIVSDGGA